MNEERTYLDYFEDIQDAIEKVALFIDGFNEEQFVQDDKTVFAVIRATDSCVYSCAICRSAVERDGADA